MDMNKVIADAKALQGEAEEIVKRTPSRAEKRYRERFVATRSRKAQRREREYQERIRRAQAGLTAEEILAAEMTAAHMSTEDLA